MNAANLAAIRVRLRRSPRPPEMGVPSATGVDARVVLAGPGARAIAFVLDWLIRSCLSLAYLLVAAWAILGDLDFNVPPRQRDPVVSSPGSMPAMAIYFLYHLVLESLMAGRTPGKRMIGLRVLTPEGLVPSVGALITRNVFRIIDSLPGVYIVGLLFVMFGRRHLRLGDLAAGTVLALERAPFLEKLAQQRRNGDDAWQEARQRAALLDRSSDAEVSGALVVVDDYRRAARTLGDRAARECSRHSRRRISRSHLRRSARHHPPARAALLAGVVVVAARPGAGRHPPRCASTCSP